MEELAECQTLEAVESGYLVQMMRSETIYILTEKTMTEDYRIFRCTFLQYHHKLNKSYNMKSELVSTTYDSVLSVSQNHLQ